MPSPIITPTLLSTLGAAASAPASMLAAQQARDSLPGAFARELHKLQIQAPTVSQPMPLQPPAPPPAQPQVRSASGPTTAPAAGPSTTVASSGARASGLHESGATSPPGANDDVGAQAAQAGDEGPTKPTDPTQDRQRQRLRSGRPDRDAGGARIGRSDASDDSRPTRSDPAERAARRRSPDAASASDLPGTATPEPAPALQPAAQPVPARSALQGPADATLQGPQADACAAGSDPAAPRVPGIDELNGHAVTLASGTAGLSGSAPATPRPPQRAAAAGDTVPSLAADGMAGAGARTSGSAASREWHAVIAGRQDDAKATLQASTTGPQPALPSFAAELARASGTQQGGAPTVATTPPAELTLPTPVTAPDFLPRLGGELALLARDGVQEARINVHPAELGPISVQIALDGTAAQVHLAVDNAQTRELLEQAMPTLAAALRDTGLTLTGGGVFQQSRQSQQEQAGADPRGTDRGRLLGDDADADLARMAAATPRRLRPLGALDVFA